MHRPTVGGTTYSSGWRKSVCSLSTASSFRGSLLKPCPPLWDVFHLALITVPSAGYFRKKICAPPRPELGFLTSRMSNFPVRSIVSASFGKQKDFLLSAGLSQTLAGGVSGISG